MVAPVRKIRLGARATVVERDTGGVLRMRAPAPLGAYPRRLTERLE
ncbi:MAG: hypothetical protein HY060_04450, partial [Proteobacteria bacterium]|nr:hypothetical protein [Pseudomonadota bacterium]